MRVMAIGLRGFPGIQGGVETHAENLYPLLVQLGCEVSVFVRSPYMRGQKVNEWRGVRFIHLWTPGSRVMGLECFFHSFLGSVYALVRRPDILHIHAIGPALMAPLGRLFGLRVVVTHHGPDYDREKWGGLARWLLKTGERLGVRYANRCIVISTTIQDMVRLKYNRDSTLIPNGVLIPEVPRTCNAITRYGLEPYRYVLLVSRFVPEKRHTDLIQAFVQAGLQGWKLVLVGSLEPPDDYIKKIQELACSNPAVVLPGFQSGIGLQEIYANAGVFVLPSSHEGLPIALLEALSFGIPVVASNIPANVEIGLPSEHYFPLGDTSALADRLCLLTQKQPDTIRSLRFRNWVRQKYDWKHIAEETFALYSDTLKKNARDQVT